MNVLYYSHHHGSGHARNAEYYSGILGDNLIIATSSPYEFKNKVHKILLPDEHETEDDFIGGREMLPDYLHYSPVGNKNILKRSNKILKACLNFEIELAIVDVSVEVAALLRSASVPFAYVRIPGNRTDHAHIECFKSATFLLAYYPKDLEDVNTPDWVVEKTIYLDFLSTLVQKKPRESQIINELKKKSRNLITVIKGYGGHKEVDAGVKKLKNKLEGYYVSVGPIQEEDKEIYDEVIEYSSNVPALMAISSRVVIPPSLNLTAEALSSHKPITVIPSKRHFNEHEMMAKNLIGQKYADDVNHLSSNFKKYEATNLAKKFIKGLKEYDNLNDFSKKYKTILP